METLGRLLTARHDPATARGWRNPKTGILTMTHPLVAATARNLLDLDLRTTSGIVATAQAHLSLFRDPILAAITAASDFSPLDLVDADRAVSLYLTLSPAEVNRLRGRLRILLNQLCRALTERLDFQPGSSRPGRREAPRGRIYSGRLGCRLLATTTAGTCHGQVANALVSWIGLKVVFGGFV